MSRPLRLAFNGAWYHIMNRGLARNPIFFTDEHRQMFIDLLIEIHDRYQAEIHAYCLMGNHYHLFIRTPLGNISRIMRHLDGVYTQRFNIKVKRDGPIFRGRYKAILVDAGEYLLQLSRYIHLNPVKANMVVFAEDYKWSSYSLYLNGSEPNWLYTAETLRYFGESDQRIKYKLYTEEGVDKETDEFFSQSGKFKILGAENFIKSVTNKYLEERHKIDDIPDHKQLIKTAGLNLHALIDLVADFYRVKRETIFVVERKRGNKPRSVAIFLIYLYANNIGLDEVANILKNISGNGIAKSYARFKEKIKNDIVVSNEIRELIRRVDYMSVVQT